MARPSSDSPSCGRCGAPAPAGRAYCTTCGASLRAIEPGACPRCGLVPAAGDAFCGGCGLALALDLAERRQLTVLFADLVGSTEMAGVLDPEDLRDVTRAHQSAVSAAVERFGGFVARYMGDGVLAYFGWPTAHEDDPERAAHAGLAAVRALADIDHTIGRPRGVAIAVRVGIATGQVVVGDVIGSGAAQEAAVVGATPNLAARLQAVAEPNQVVVAGPTRRRLGRDFAARDLGARRLKGIAEPVEVFAVTLASAAAPRATRPPLVGREVDLAWLASRWDAAATGHGRLVLLGGEPGIGKSHLISTFLEGRPAVVLQGIALEATSALHPVLAWARRRAGASDMHTRDEQKERILGARWATTETAALLIWALGLESDDRLDAEERARRLREVLVEEVLAAASGPRAVLVEDAHWLDPSTLTWIDALRVRATELPVLVVVSFRPGFDPPWAGERRDLSRIDDPTTRAIVEQVAGAPLPDEVVRHVARKTDGVPLFVEELTRMLLESGHLERDTDRWRLASPLETLSVPETLQDSLMARLDRLGFDKSIAQVAAVIGRRFERELLIAVAHVPPAHVDTALERLVEARLVDADEDGFSFRHALVQETAVASLLRTRRRALHAEVADALRARHDSAPERVAHHLAGAGRTAEAIAAWRLAAEQAARRFANAEAIELLELAIRCAESATPPDREQAIALRIRLAERARTIEQLDRAHQVLEEARALAGEDDAHLSAIWFQHGNAWFHPGDLERCLESHRRARHHADRAGDPKLQAAALGGLGDAMYLHNRFREALDYFEECVAICARHGLAEMEAAHRMMIGWSGIHLGRLDLARESGLRAQASAAALGLPRAELVATGLVAWHAIETGDLRHAFAQARHALALAERLGAIRFVGTGHMYVTLAHATAGDRAATRDAALAGLRAIHGTAAATFAEAALHGWLAAATDDPADRAAHLASGEALLTEDTFFSGQLWFRISAIDAALADHDPDEADRHADVIDRIVGGRGALLCDFYVARGRALADQLRDPRRAVDALSAALELGVTIGVGPALVPLRRALAS